MNSSLLITLAIVTACAGCAGLKKFAETAAQSPAANELQKASATPASGQTKAPPTQQIEPEPRVIQGAPALEVPTSQENCLALNVYYEAGVEHHIGKLAIANVTINRLNTGRWGDSLCDVVYAASQFSWTATAEKLPKPTGPSWAESRKAARHAIEGKRIESLGKALYYHASYVTPYWRKQTAKIQQIGRHIFYSGARVAQSGAATKVAQTVADN